MSERQSPAFEVQPPSLVEPIRFSELMGRPMHTPEPEPQPEPEPVPEPEQEPETQPEPEHQPEPEQEPEEEIPRLPSVHFRPIPSKGWFKPLLEMPRGNYCCVAKECKC